MVASVSELAWLPRPPNWELDWPAVRHACPWLGPLADTPQDPLHHAEGDVLTHTEMVVRELIELVEWQGLDSEERALLFIAALLHDIGKPRATRVEADRIVSPGHARIGAQISRQLLWTPDGLGMALPLRARERVSGLVALHGLPIWFLDRPDLERAILSASYRAPLHQVALLAEADARGRVCGDPDELLARVELFRGLCRERDCFYEPHPFPNASTRVRYLRGLQTEPRYAAFDASWGEVTMLSGLPAAGKDTWLRTNLDDTPVVSLDMIRRELRVAPEGNQGAVVALAKERAREMLRRRQPFAWNATNVTRNLRGPLVDLMLAYGARVRQVHLDAPLPTILARNRVRPAPVPEVVVRRLAGKAEPPDWSEGHRVDWVEGG